MNFSQALRHIFSKPQNLIKLDKKMGGPLGINILSLSISLNLIYTRRGMEVMHTRGDGDGLRDDHLNTCTDQSYNGQCVSFDHYVRITFYMLVDIADCDCCIFYLVL